jgi:hypothetical protein
MKIRNVQVWKSMVGVSQNRSRRREEALTFSGVEVSLLTSAAAVGESMQNESPQKRTVCFGSA